jgi:hypothetical protein
MYYPYHAKKTGDTKLISTAGSLHIGPFILHTSTFQPVVQGVNLYTSLSGNDHLIVFFLRSWSSHIVTTTENLRTVPTECHDDDIIPSSHDTPHPLSI